jgi:excinuclease ABC subunit A
VRRGGEFLDLFADMQAPGYVRFRVDGKLVEADELPELKKNRKARHRCPVCSYSLSALEPRLRARHASADLLR